jgi:hypothetical protein
MPDTALLAGPYTPPPLRKGDRETCLYRDCLVVVTSWTAAPIPWPRCRRLDCTKGGSGRTPRCGMQMSVTHEGLS